MMKREKWLLASILLALFAGRSEGRQAAPPRPDHVVVVIEENHSYSSIIGNGSAPYINSLATQGALFTSSFAITHPSQPNYLAFFSGSTQGVTDDVVPPAGSPYSGPNLGSELLAAGQSFAGYSEDQPSVGYTGAGSGGYVRKHNPWVDFTNVPSSSNLPWTQFPAAGAYSSLPTVSIVVPNLTDDMHDGTIAQGDSWLQSNLDAYVQWAKTHNSLLIVTWDEDDGSSTNQIATIFVGPMVTPGTTSQTINHYSVLRTIEDMYGLTHAGTAQSATPIQNVWTSTNPPPPDVPPAVSLTSPADQASFPVPATVQLSAAASDSDGTVTKVEFFQGTTLLGTATAAPYSYTWTNVAAGSYTLTAKATDNAGLSATSSVVHITVTAGPGGGGGSLPPPWQDGDVGAVCVAGSASYDSTTGTFTLNGAGTDLWNTSDAFHFAYQSFSGDGSIIARVTGLGNSDPWANAGVALRDSLSGDAVQAILVVTASNGVVFQARSSAGTAPASTAGSSSTVPVWLKLARTGSTVTAFESADGQQWSSIGTATLPFGASVEAGLVVEDQKNAALNQATFTSVSVGTARAAPGPASVGGSGGGSSGCGLLGLEALLLSCFAGVFRRIGKKGKE